MSILLHSKNLTSHKHISTIYFPILELTNYIPRRKSGIYWIQVRRAAAVEISLWTR